MYKGMGPPLTLKSGPTAIELDLSSIRLDVPAEYESRVRPVLERRCVVCHGCYDAPCQLKLSTIEGLQRGGSEELVYNPSRIMPMQPTRLFVDARSVAEWRDRGFHPVLNEGPQTTEDNLTNSVLYRLLRL